MPTTISANPNLALTTIQKFVPLYMSKKQTPSKSIGYDTRNSSLSAYKYQGESEFGLPVVTNEGTSGPIDSFYTPFQMTVTAYKRMIGFIASTEALETDQYGVMGKVSMKLAMAHSNAEEYAFANLFNTGFTATTVSPDAVALFSSSGLSSGTGHTTVDASTPFNNRGIASGTTYADAAFGYMALENALLTFYSAISYRAQPMMMTGSKKLIVPPSLAGIANRVVNSTKIPQSTDNDSNYAGSQVSGTIINPFLTSTTAWFLVDTETNPLFKVNRRGFTVDTDKLVREDARLWMTTGIYAFGVDKPQGLWGTAGA